MQLKVKQLIVLTKLSNVRKGASNAVEVNDISIRLQTAEGRNAWLTAIRRVINEQSALEKTVS